jgi:hypothetical protein
MPADSKFCASCGTPVSASSIAQSAPPAPTPPTSLPLAGPPPGSSSISAPSKKKSFKGCAIILGALFLVLVIIIGVLIMSFIKFQKEQAQLGQKYESSIKRGQDELKAGKFNEAKATFTEALGVQGYAGKKDEAQAGLLLAQIALGEANAGETYLSEKLKALDDNTLASIMKDNSFPPSLTTGIEQADTKLKVLLPNLAKAEKARREAEARKQAEAEKEKKAEEKAGRERGEKAETEEKHEIMDVHQVAGKNEKEIEKLFGKPSFCKKTKLEPGLNANSCSYAKNGIEIDFIRGKADWITIKQMGDAKYDKNSLQLLGLKVKSPDFSNDNVMRWNKIEGIAEIDFFPGGKGGIFYVQIASITLPQISR